jgi:hypothetical protein
MRLFSACDGRECRNGLAEGWVIPLNLAAGYFTEEKWEDFENARSNLLYPSSCVSTPLAVGVRFERWFNGV